MLVSCVVSFPYKIHPPLAVRKNETAKIIDSDSNGYTASTFKTNLRMLTSNLTYKQKKNTVFESTVICSICVYQFLWFWVRYLMILKNDIFFLKLNKGKLLNDAFTKVTPLKGKLFHSPNNEENSMILPASTFNLVMLCVSIYMCCIVISSFLN